MKYRLRLRPATWAVDLGALLLAWALVVLLCALATGCRSTGAGAQKTLAGIQHAADAAMQVWGWHVAREQRRLDALPEAERVAGHGKLLAQRLDVDHARTQFSAAWATAFAAARFNRDEPPGPQVLQLLTNLETTINAFSK